MTDILTIPAYIVWNNFEGELALFDTRDGAYHALNRTAASIWRAIGAGHQADEIIDLLSTQAKVAPELVADDVHAFIADARARGLLVSGEPAA